MEISQPRRQELEVSRPKAGFLLMTIMIMMTMMVMIMIMIMMTMMTVKGAEVQEAQLGRSRGGPSRDREGQEVMLIGKAKDFLCETNFSDTNTRLFSET